MSYTTQEGRTQILDDAAAAAQRLGVALSELGEAYEHLDDQAADRMEEQVFRPLQGAYGHLKRTLTEFAARVGLPSGEFPVAAMPAPENPRLALEHAADEIQAADDMLSELQDSLLPVEVGDRELRTGLSTTRTQIASLPAACDELVRIVGR